MMTLVLLLAQSLGGLPAQEPSVVPQLLNPGNVKKLVAAPGGLWAFARPRDAVDIGRDARTQTLSLGLPVGRRFCELRLTTVNLPTGNAASLALSEERFWSSSSDERRSVPSTTDSAVSCARRFHCWTDSIFVVVVETSVAVQQLCGALG